MKFTGDRSSILGTRPIITPSGKLRAKNGKNYYKKLREDYVVFLVHFRIYYLKIFEGGGLGAWPQINAPPNSPLTTPLCRPHAVLIFDPSQCFYCAMHFSAKRGLAIALCRPSVCDVGGL